MRFVSKAFSELTTTELYELLKVRSQVFVVELNMHCLDMDGVDYIGRHFYLEDNGKICAYLRAFYTDDAKQTVRIGRVLSAEHGVGWGAELMRCVLEDIPRTMPCKTVCLDSQKHAEGFYKKFGFTTVSGEFLEEGVVHVAMSRPL